MADNGTVTIGDLPGAGPLLGSELVAAWQAGATVALPAADFATAQAAADAQLAADAAQGAANDATATANNALSVANSAPKQVYATVDAGVQKTTVNQVFGVDTGAGAVVNYKNNGDGTATATGTSAPTQASIDAIASTISNDARLPDLLNFSDGSVDQINLGGFRADGSFFANKYDTPLSYVLRFVTDISDGSGDLLQIIDASDDQVLLFRIDAAGVAHVVISGIDPVAIANATSQAIAAAAAANSATASVLKSRTMNMLRRSAERASVANVLTSGQPSPLPALTASLTPSSGNTKEVNVWNNQSQFSLFGGQPYLVTSWGLSTTRFRSVSSAAATYVQNAISAEFFTDALKIDIRLGQSATLFRIAVDGQYINPNGTAYLQQSAAPYASYASIDFTSLGRKARRIRVEFEQDVSIISVCMGPLESVWAASSADDLKVACIGDSYSTGTGAIMENDAWNCVAAKLLGIQNLQQIALGGTGYVNAGTSWTFGAHVSDLSLQAFDIVMIAGGINDAGMTGIQAAATSLFTSVRQLLPNAIIFVLGSWAGARGPSAAILSAEADIKAAYTAWADGNSYYIPVSADPQPYFYGTGTAGATNGSGNSDYYVGGTTGTDATHPYGATGHRYLGSRVAAAISNLIKDA